MEYVLLNIAFSGNDDAYVEGFIAREVESKKEWFEQIKQAIKDELKDGDGFLEIYNSDNCSTPFESVEEVLNTFTMKQITKDDFLVLSKLFGGDQNVVSYGHTDSFLDYNPPIIKEKAKIKPK